MIKLISLSVCLSMLTIGYVEAQTARKRPAAVEAADPQDAYKSKRKRCCEDLGLRWDERGPIGACYTYRSTSEAFAQCQS